MPSATESSPTGDGLVTQDVRLVVNYKIMGFVDAPSGLNPWPPKHEFWIDDDSQAGVLKTKEENGIWILFVPRTNRSLDKIKINSEGFSFPFSDH